MKRVYKLIIILTFLLFSCDSSIQSNKEVKKSDDIISYQAKIPITKQVSLNSGFKKYKFKKEDNLVFSIDGIKYEFDIKFNVIAEAQISNWVKAFTHAENGAKLLTPAVFSDLDNEFLMCKSKSEIAFLLMDESLSNVRGVVGIPKNNSYIVYYRCDGVVSNTSHEAIFEVVFSFIDYYFAEKLYIE